jgi:hypothetical protein
MSLSKKIHFKFLFNKMAAELKRKTPEQKFKGFDNQDQKPWNPILE